jgi:hypothetical protein
MLALRAVRVFWGKATEADKAHLELQIQVVVVAVLVQ